MTWLKVFSRFRPHKSVFLNQNPGGQIFVPPPTILFRTPTINRNSLQQGHDGESFEQKTTNNNFFQKLFLWRRKKKTWQVFLGWGEKLN